jgi:hypothetical protein
MQLMARDFDILLAADLLNKFGEESAQLFKLELEKIGLGEKYPSGVDVDLWRSVQHKVNQDLVVSIEMLPHWFWVVKGRRSKEENPSAKPPPFAVILEWIKEKRKFQFRDKKGRFLSYNQTAWIVRNGILRNVSKPRNFVRPAVKASRQLWREKQADAAFAFLADLAESKFQTVRIRKTKNLKIVR